MFARIALRAMLIALATLPAVGALVASADDGPPRRPDATGRPSGTVLRQIRPLPPSGAVPDTSFSATAPAAFAAIPGAAAGARELVLFVGGMSSTLDDGTFAVLAGRLAGDPRYEVRRFGADPRYPYDTRQALDPSADALIAEIRERAPMYSGVDLVTHSMGGAVAQHMALMAPERVHTLMMCASFAKLDAFGRRVLSNMRDVLEMTGSWAAHARHSVQNFVSADFFDSNPERIKHAETVVFENFSHFFLMEEPGRFMDTINDWLARHTPRV